LLLQKNYTPCTILRSQEEESGKFRGACEHKHLDEFRSQSFDYVVTVCDRVRESCPTFPGDPKEVHWSFIDPAAVEGSERERSRAFEQVALQLTNRIRYLVILIDREQGERI